MRRLPRIRHRLGVVLGIVAGSSVGVASNAPAHPGLGVRELVGAAQTTPTLQPVKPGAAQPTATIRPTGPVATMKPADPAPAPAPSPTAFQRPPTAPTAKLQPLPTAPTPPPPPANTTTSSSGSPPPPTNATTSNRPPPPPPAPGNFAVPAKEVITIGAGVSDITGPAAEVGMMGYAKSEQKTSGIHMRLYARAFVFANPSTGKRVVFVSAEIGQLFSSIKQGVMRNLAARYGALYTDANVQLAATHTHAGPGGYSHHALMNFTSFGFVKESYDAIVQGITAAIVQAHDRASPGSLRVANGDVMNASVNRSTPAFRRNPDQAGELNRLMTTVTIDRPSGAPTGAISWFAVHNTSLPQTNTLIGSDNKGYAAYRMEKERGTILPFQNPGGFVAAFPNSDEGDLSPNIASGFTGPGVDPFDSVRIIGDRQYERADALSRSSGEHVGGVIDFRHTFTRMPGLVVTGTTQRNGAGGNTLCNGAYGASFAAGAEDGPSGLGGFSEGMVYDARNAAGWENLRRSFMNGPMPGPFRNPFQGVFNAADAVVNDPCQRPKPVLLPSGFLGWTPDVLPFQLLRVGSLAIAGVPSEMTVQAGRRLRARIASSLAPKGVRHVIITGLANEYSGYVTTPEEYDAQNYEGASTQFGRLTLDAYLQVFGQLADAMAAGTAVPAGAVQPDKSQGQITLQTGVVYDDKRLVETFGQVMQQPPASVNRGGTVTATFRAGHPKNGLRTNDSYLLVERKVGTSWQRVAWDSMPETRYTWRRDTAADCLACSFADVRWDVPASALTGTYRIRQLGAWKHGVTGVISQYVGTTREFQVR